MAHNFRKMSLIKDTFTWYVLFMNFWFTLITLFETFSPHQEILHKYILQVMKKKRKQRDIHFTFPDAYVEEFCFFNAELKIVITFFWEKTKKQFYCYSVCKSSRSEAFYKINVLKNFAKFTRKHFCWDLFLNILRNPGLQLY